MRKLTDAFPELKPEFFKLLRERIEENEFTDYRLEQTVKHIIDTYQYPNPPKIADFIVYGKGVPLIKPDTENPYKVREDWKPSYRYKSNADK
jgi:hypothetical protein